MALRSGRRKLSYEILSGNSSVQDDEEEAAAAGGIFYRSNSDPIRSHAAATPRRKRRKKKRSAIPNSSIPESATADENGLEFNFSQTVLCSVADQSSFAAAELRQRTVNAGAGGASSDETAPSGGGFMEGEANAEEDSAVELSTAAPVAKPNGNLVTKLKTAESLDWQRVMAEDPNYMCSVDKSPLKYFMEEMSNGNSLRSTTTLGNEKERERVYDTIFRLPWRCELLIDVGIFVCFDSFLSLLTIMPTRILMTLWRLVHTRQFKRPSPAELSDFGCFTIMACGVILLEQTDISLIYHMIRGQGTIKLYVVYNVLEIFDKLCQSFNGDVLQTLFNSADGLASCPTENMGFWIWRFTCDQALAVTASILHSFILLAQAITLSTCIVAHNNALFALLVSNNFAEIKSNVFKRYSKENIHSLVYFDSIERFHISAFIIFILAQNILEAEGPWFENFIFNAGLVFICEIIVDIVKHSFIAKFNDIKPIAYSEFLEDLCKQTLNIQPEAAKKNLTFIPIAPACVVIRVLTPVYAAHLPHSPLPWKLFWILILFAMTYVMLTSLKVLVGMGLQKHASWYVNRCKRRKHHLHYD
ncbi:protein POLLEN DEFECTIVE IN GUIDANCE 1 [Argentina anserina]|uniref:protein POLLEN DEFECTIVE IN GUIDANCE 1 n=1 Tax=Argentina anserina TaxID=57926 RepID=UPI0021764331|nr:protein POLLEN DEFECTIVE IN GUIDANCE 1 [Potentilla anserina]XP_050371853.1 protein POLLEN DEFECTIVE IN GUIDANCE 1 [Potentilla anserina]